MPELSGPIQPIELASWLWLIPFFPLVGVLLNALHASGFLGQAFRALRRAFADATSTPPAGSRVLAPHATVGRIAFGTLALAALASLAACGLLAARAPEGRYLLDPLFQLIRVGSVDVGANLALDPLSAVLVMVVTVLGTAVAFHASASGVGATPEEPWRFFVWLEAFVFFLILALLADDAFFLLFAWQGVALSGWALAGLSETTGSAVTSTRAFLAQRSADLGLVLGVALLFWGLGGAWDQGGVYQPEIGPRLAAVAVTATDAAPRTDPSYVGEAAMKGSGYLTVAALPDSLVYLDDSRVPLLDAKGFPLRTPFRRHAIPGGAHSVRVAPDDSFRGAEHDAKVPYVLQGGVLTNYSIARTAFGADHELALAVLGPTLRFREIRDQLVLSDARGIHPGREGLAARRLGGVGAVGRLGLATIACLLILVGVFARSAQVPLRAWLPTSAAGSASVSALVQGVGSVLLGVYLVARLAAFFSLSRSASIALVAVGLLTAVVGALGTVAQRDLAKVMAYGTASQLGLAFVALGAHAEGVAIFQVVVHAVVRTSLVLSAAAVVASRKAKDGGASGDLRDMAGAGVRMPGVASAYRLACVALAAAPIPLVGTFWPSGAVIASALATRAIPATLGTACAGALVLVMGLTSLGVWRSYYLVFEGRSRAPRGKKRGETRAPETSTATSKLLRGLSVAAVVFGLVLGASARDVGGEAGPLLEEWLEPVFATTGARVEGLSPVGHLGVVALGFLAAFVGWWWAKRTYGPGRRDDWASRELRVPILGAKS